MTNFIYELFSRSRQTSTYAAAAAASLTRTSVLSLCCVVRDPTSRRPR